MERAQSRPGIRPRISLQKLIRLTIALLLIAAVSSCGGSDQQVTYRPPYLPFKIVYSVDDGISIEGEKSFVTSFGTFSIGAKYSIEETTDQEILVVIRDRNADADHIYKVKSGKGRFVAEIDGRTIIEVVDRQVIIDVTGAEVTNIGFKSATGEGISEADESWWSARRGAWDKGWEESWYKPYAMTRWAYDDSTITKAYGFGFVWFLVRLVFAIALALVDTVLSAGFLIGQIGYLIAGPTLRNILYGLMVLTVLGFVVALMYEEMY